MKTTSMGMESALARLLLRLEDTSLRPMASLLPGASSRLK